MAITMVRFALKPIDLVKKKTDEQTMHDTRTPRRSNQAEVVLMWLLTGAAFTSSLRS
jgi:hypothetical protein